MFDTFLFAILLLSPLLGFFINGLSFKSSDIQRAGFIASGCVLASFLTALQFFIRFFYREGGQRTFHFHFFDWIHVEGFQAPMAFTLDSLSIVMVLIITGVGFLIHIFSMGYMSGDPRPAKYFSYLNLFIFNMLLLVSGNNLLVMFVGWEGVGLCSYLLIGFWFSDPQKATAGMKAFVTNRIGDAGFLLGIFSLFFVFGTLDFSEISDLAAGRSVGDWSSLLTWACLFLFIGAVGKSAQIPLYVWLPDAMAGPTPVSALIHAATMVTAGVYMIIRLSGVYILSPGVMMIVAGVGVLTALGAATIGLVQNDIKKVLAYSTVSQLGYMFLAVGVGAFSAALAHLMTHAFFKALMFLGSGSVIHAMGGEQDMRKMGGLRAFMPLTHMTFLVGWLAIIGTPLLSGFFSKDEILWMAYSSPRGHFVFWFLGVVAAVCTAFYMTRLMALTFWGVSRVDSKVHPHESPSSMSVPLVILAFLSLFAGGLCVPHGVSALLPFHPPNLLHHWIEPVVTSLSPARGSLKVEWFLMSLSLLCVTIGVFLALEMYVIKTPESREKDKPQGVLSFFYKLLLNKYWVDEFYGRVFLKPLVRLGEKLWEFVDRKFIERVISFICGLVKDSAEGLRLLQTGQIQTYVFYILIGLVVSLVTLVTRF